MDNEIRVVDSVEVRCDGYVKYSTKTGTRDWNNGCDDGYGYRQIRNPASNKSQRIHVLVARAFLGEIESGFEVDHIDGDRSNNNLSNLRIVSKKSNCRNKVINRIGKEHNIDFDPRYKKDPWRIRFYAKGFNKRLGGAPSLEEAIIKRDEFIVNNSLI